MKSYLSDSDKKVYAFIRNRLIHGDDVPTLAEINNITGKSSPRSGVLVLDRLVNAGLIKRSGRKMRLIGEWMEDNNSISTVAVPLVGQVAAGAPIFAEENIEATISVTTALARPGYKYFLLRVVGDSMDMMAIKGENIENGSIVLVRQQSSANDGDVIVALIDDSATVKIFERRNGVVILRPKSSNEKHRPIVLTDNCVIQGVVVAVLPPDLH